MRITLYEDEIKDAIIRELYDKVGKLSISREDIRLQDAGIGQLKLIAEIDVEAE
ncbi:hypothetical protein [Neobacillus sp. DY30]|uniref:hypothetical protein n=1 Tax=Neobacillus sp. DY30 TaxID=3047871 RepID=UPI0024BF7BC8|nr:hypothetical protein [Neobacillus sp. DY30]WHY01858.1 hypothetical protein QNH29_06415 [Neobacillus sp. DY30]